VSALRVIRRLIWCTGANICAATLGAAEVEPPLLTTVQQVRQLSPEEAARRYPVKLQGVITYLALGQPFRFLQDQTGGTYFSSPYPKPDDGNTLTPGTIVEVEGVTVPGRFAPYVGRGDEPAVRWRVLGHGPLPAARRVSIGELADPQFHSDYIEVSGVVRQVKSREMADAQTEVVWIKIGSNTSAFTAQFFDPRGMSRLPERFIGARVTVRGVYGSMFNEKRQMVGFRLFVDPERGFTVDRPGPAQPLHDLAATPISALMQFQGETRETPMVRIHGTVTHIVPGRGIYLENGEHGVWAESDEDLSVLRPGMQASAVGFPALGAWNPVLKDAVFRAGIAGPELSPRPITGAEARSGTFDCRRVIVEATVLEVFERGETPGALLQQGDTTFVAEWSARSDETESANLLPGSVVHVTGICLNKRPEGSWAAYEAGPYDALVRPQRATFRLLVATPDDLRVARAPDWWTPERIWTALGALGLGALAILGWNVSLRRRVTVQTEIIRAQSTREAVHEDRTRIARELHDTLEQELTGIAVQLDAVSDRLAESPPAAATALATARALLRHTRTEARRSVWDLRAALLDEGDLPSALRATAQHLDGGPSIRVEIEGEPRRLAAALENNLLRIATEAMTNAVKHAQAGQIVVRLEFADDQVALEIGDDGRGFDASRSTTLAAGHFGWLGIRERTERIGGSLSVRSAPGAGTQVAVRVRTASPPVTPLPESVMPGTRALDSKR
jgi:signal transduction histidine kinase